MAAYQDGHAVFEEFILPNDPLYLIKGTNCPKPFDQNTAFEPYGGEDGNFPIKVKYDGKHYTVNLKFSVAKADFRRTAAESGTKAGNLPIGKHSKRNQGISLIRANREIELSSAFDIPYDPTDRWWGIEVSFEPELDAVFGVTNNKQATTAFQQISAADIAIDEEISRSKVKTFLEDENDIRLPILIISEEISNKLSTIRQLIEGQTKGVKLKKKSGEETNSSTEAANKVTNKDGKTGESDELEIKLSVEEKTKQLEEELVREGVFVNDADKEAIVKGWLSDGKYIFSSANLRGSRCIFDVSQPAGKLKVTINSNHPAYEQFIQEIEKEDGHAFGALKLLFAAWARLEDIETKDDEKRRKFFEDIRFEWGAIAKKMLDEYE